MVKKNAKIDSKMAKLEKMLLLQYSFE